MYQAFRQYPIHEDLLVAFESEAYEKALQWANYHRPNEFLLIPICGLILREDKSPLRQLTLSDVATVVIVDYIHPPYQLNTPSHTSIIPEKREESGRLVTEELNKMREKWPRLGHFVKFHAHPFSNGRFLSGGDISHNLVGEKLAIWQADKGMEFVPMQVIWPIGATWNITTFLYIAQELHTTQPPRIMDKENSRFSQVYDPAFWQNNNWLDEQKMVLKERWEGTTTRQLGRGWMQVYVPTEKFGYLLCLPPDFPEESMELHIVPPTQNPQARYVKNITVDLPLEQVNLMHLVDRIVRRGS